MSPTGVGSIGFCGQSSKWRMSEVLRWRVCDSVLCGAGTQLTNPCQLTSGQVPGDWLELGVGLVRARRGDGLELGVGRVRARCGAG